MFHIIQVLQLSFLFNVFFITSAYLHFFHLLTFNLYVSLCFMCTLEYSIYLGFSIFPPVCNLCLLNGRVSPFTFNITTSKFGFKFILLIFFICSIYLHSFLSIFLTFFLGGDGFLYIIPFPPLFIFLNSNKELLTHKLEWSFLSPLDLRWDLQCAFLTSSQTPLMLLVQ